MVGGGKTEAPLAYLTVRDAAALRERLLALAGRTAGRRSSRPPPPGDCGTGRARPRTPAAPGQQPRPGDQPVAHPAGVLPAARRGLRDHPVRDGGLLDLHRHRQHGHRDGRRAAPADPPGAAGLGLPAGPRPERPAGGALRPARDPQPGRAAQPGAVGGRHLAAALALAEVAAPAPGHRRLRGRAGRHQALRPPAAGRRLRHRAGAGLGRAARRRPGRPGDLATAVAGPLVQPVRAALPRRRADPRGLRLPLGPAHPRDAPGSVRPAAERPGRAGPVAAPAGLATVYADTAGGRSGQAKDRDLAEAWALADALADPRPAGPRPAPLVTDRLAPSACRPRAVRRILAAPGAALKLGAMELPEFSPGLDAPGWS